MTMLACRLHTQTYEDRLGPHVSDFHSDLVLWFIHTSSRSQDAHRTAAPRCRTLHASSLRRRKTSVSLLFYGFIYTVQAATAVLQASSKSFNNSTTARGSRGDGVYRMDHPTTADWKPGRHGRSARKTSRIR